MNHAGESRRPPQALVSDSAGPLPRGGAQTDIARSIPEEDRSMFVYGIEEVESGTLHAA